ncbi:MAG: F0F1 ATP synthase subunit delta [Patescibacteria group bacterium]
MKYSARFYAKALAEVIHDGKEKDAASHLVSILKKNGDLKHLPEIIRLTEKALIEKDGGRSVVIETARPIADIEKKLHSFLKKEDSIETKVNPDLVAGVRVTINGESQIDASLQSELSKLLA